MEILYKNSFNIKHEFFFIINLIFKLQDKIYARINFSHKNDVM